VIAGRDYATVERLAREAAQQVALARSRSGAQQ
jgi:hypothetical protein